MRTAALPGLVLLAACQAVGAPGAPLLAIPAAVEGLSLRAFGRTSGDAVVSLITGEDCSIARIGRGEAYCGREDPPAPPPMCTRSLGAVDCWTVPPAAFPAYRGVADGPAALTPAQENHRIGWTGRIARALTPPAPAGATPVEALPPPSTAEPVILPAPVNAPAVDGTAAGAARRALEAPPSAEGR